MAPGSRDGTRSGARRGSRERTGCEGRARVADFGPVAGTLAEYMWGGGKTGKCLCSNRSTPPPGKRPPYNCTGGPVFGGTVPDTGSTNYRCPPLNRRPSAPKGQQFSFAAIIHFFRFDFLCSCCLFVRIYQNSGMRIVAGVAFPVPSIARYSPPAGWGGRARRPRHFPTRPRAPPLAPDQAAPFFCSHSQLQYDNIPRSVAAISRFIFCLYFCGYFFLVSDASSADKTFLFIPVVDIFLRPQGGRGLSSVSRPVARTPSPKRAFGAPPRPAGPKAAARP